MKKSYSADYVARVPANQRVAIVQSRWHSEHTDRMVHACADILLQCGVAEVVPVKVPGCYEIPLITKRLAQSGRFAAIVVFGAIVRGDTDHYRLILDTCIRELGKVMYDFEIPIINEILPVHTVEHLIERSTGDGNKGIEAAHAAVEMLQLCSSLSCEEHHAR